MWTTLRTVAPLKLREARVLVHWAAQIPASAANRLRPSQADYSQTTLGWSWATQSLLTHALSDGGPAVRAGFRVVDGSLVIVRGTEVAAAASLDGQTVTQGQEWLARGLREVLGRPVGPFSQLEHSLPAHPVGSNAAFRFAPDDPARLELARWLANAHAVLERWLRGNDRANEVRLWPHHFDVASLVRLGPGRQPGHEKSVTFGVSLGDEHHEQPYVYVAPWPRPADSVEAAPLTRGNWHRDGFFAAVLSAQALLEGDAAGQSVRVEQFLEEAGGRASALLGVAASSRPHAKLVWHKAAEPGELAEGRVKSVTAGHRGVCLTRFEGCYAALTDVCPHQGGPLGEGSIENGWLRCPWHGWDFHPRTGQSPGDHEDGLDTFSVEVRDDGVYVGVEAEPPHARDVSDVMVETMTAWGVRWVFGMVGHSNLGLADAVRRRCEAGELGYLGVRHEGAASFAVSAYGKLTGRPAACLAIAGPGATNLLTGLWDANVDRAPALALTGQVNSQVLGRGAFQEIDLLAAYGGVARFRATVLRDSDVAELMNLACKAALVGRSVSHLVFPDEVQTRPAIDTEAGGPEGRVPNLEVSPAKASLDAAERALRGAKRPLIIVGHGARFSMEAVRRFAESFGIPVATTFKAKGQISDRHPLGCGVLGRSGTPVASWFMNEADLLLVLGSSFSNHTGISDYKPIVQIDFEPDALGRRHRVTTPVLGEIGLTLAALQARMQGHKGFVDPRGEVAQRWAIWRAEKAKRLRDDSGAGLNSAAIFDALTKTAPSNAILAVDVGNNTYSFGRYFEADQQAVLMSGYLGSIGFALPAAMGAWVATQEGDGAFEGRKVISICGDGGLGQYLADFTTWVKYGMNMTLVVLNNSELGKISKEQRVGGWDVWETSLCNPGFAEFATNCGALGIRVTARPQVEAAFTQAFEHPGPALVEIVSDPMLV